MVGNLKLVQQALYYAIIISLTFTYIVNVWIQIYYYLNSIVIIYLKFWQISKQKCFKVIKCNILTKSSQEITSFETKYVN